MISSSKYIMLIAIEIAMHLMWEEKLVQKTSNPVLRTSIHKQEINNSNKLKKPKEKEKEREKIMKKT